MPIHPGYVLALGRDEYKRILVNSCGIEHYKGYAKKQDQHSLIIGDLARIARL